MITSLRLVLGITLLAGIAGFAQAPKGSPTPSKPPATAFKEAQAFYTDGEWVKALEAFQAFERNYQFSLAMPDSIFYQGWCLANLGRHQEAINVLQRLVTTFSNNVLVAEAILKQAEAYRELNNVPKAVELYRKFQQSYPQHDLLSQAMLGEAWAVFKGNEAGKAKQIIRIVQAKFMDNPEVQLNALFLLGQIYTEEKDFVSANQIYRQITRQRNNPRATEALYLAAEAVFGSAETLARDNKTEESKKAYRDAITYYKGVRSKAALQEALQRELEQLNAVRGRLGIEGWQRRSDALKRLMAQIKERPDLRVLALFRVANCYQALDMPEEASVVYQYLLDRYPGDRAEEQIWFGLIQTLTQRGQAKRADELSEQFRKKFPNAGGTDSVQMMQAEAQFRQLRYKEALAAYEKAVGSTKNQQTAELIEFRIAQCNFELAGEVKQPDPDQQATKYFEKARDAFSAFSQKRPESKIRPDALFFLGLTHYELANHSGDTNVARSNIESGIKAYDEVRTKYPQAENVAEATFRLGYMYSFHGTYDKTSYDKAIATFEEYIKKWPTGPKVAEAMYQIGRNNISAERPEQAVAAYKALVEKFPDHDLSPFAALEIASTYASMKPAKMAEFVEALRAFVKKYPSHPKVGDALSAIAVELETEKRFDEAIPAYREIINRALATETLTDEARNGAIYAMLRISGILEQRNDPKLVVADLEQFIQKFANDPVAARALVNQVQSVYKKNKLAADGMAKLEQLAQQYAANAAIRHAAVVGMIDLADDARANALVVRLLADPDKDKLPPPALVSIGEISLKTEKFAQAKENYEKALASAGDDAKVQTVANTGLGQALYGLKEYDAAQEAYLKALSDKQNAPLIKGIADIGLGEVYEAKGKINEALPLFQQHATDKGPMGFKAAFKAGNILFNTVSPDAMQTKTNKIAALSYYARLLFAPPSPMSEEAAYRSGECHEALGNPAQACAMFQSYLKRFPTGKFVDDAKAKIRKVCPTKPE